MKENNSEDVYKITVEKGPFSAYLELEMLDDEVNGVFTIYYEGEEIKSCDICSECLHQAVDVVIEEIDSFENLKRAL